MCEYNACALTSVTDIVREVFAKRGRQHHGQSLKREMQACVSADCNHAVYRIDAVIFLPNIMRDRKPWGWE